MKERRKRYRQETVTSILAVAREVMQEQGVAALNLNEVARRLGVTGQALAKYFPNKAALYDALYLFGHRLFRESEELIWQTTAPDWDRIRQWFEVRFALAVQHPDLYHLIWERSVPDVVPSAASKEDMRAMLTNARRGIGQVMTAGHIRAGIPVERVVDILLAVRHGLIAEHLAKRELAPAGSERFHGLIPDILVALQKAWAPRASGRTPKGRGLR